MLHHLFPRWDFNRVSVQGVKSHGGHFERLCRRFDFYEVKKKYYHTFTLLIIFTVESLQKEQIAQILYYEPQSAGINLQITLN